MHPVGGGPSNFGGEPPSITWLQCGGTHVPEEVRASFTADDVTGDEPRAVQTPLPWVPRRSSPAARWPRAPG